MILILQQGIHIHLQQEEPDVRAFRFSCVDRSDLPLADALHPDPKGPLQTSAELEGIAADLDYVVNESTHGSQREGRGEEHHVAKLDKHLLVVLEGVLTGRWQEHFDFTATRSKNKELYRYKQG